LRQKYKKKNLSQAAYDNVAQYPKIPFQTDE